jgi:hypothetical protein
MTHHAHGDSIHTQFNHTRRIISNFIISCFRLISNTENYIIVILDNSLVFRMTIPDAVLIQFDFLRTSKILLEICTCRGL